MNKKPKKLSEEEKIEAIKEKIKKDRKKQQSIIADANKTLTAKRRIAETKAEIKQKELAARAKKKALKIAAKKLEAQQEESTSKINQKKLSKRELKIMELKEEIRLLGIDVNKKRDDLASTEKELTQIKEKGDVNDVIKQNVLTRKVGKYKAEVKTISENMSKKQAELDKLLGARLPNPEYCER